MKVPQILRIILSGAVFFSPLSYLRAEPASAGAGGVTAENTEKKETNDPPVVKAIKALGPKATPKQIGAVVFLLVKQDPAHILSIVFQAVRFAPVEAAAEIVACATAAAPEPWKIVRYALGTLEALPLGENPEEGSALLSSDKVVTLTLVEAIVKVALIARPEADQGLLESAAEGALRGNPDILLMAANDVTVIAAVGFAGAPNYGNEPLKKRMVNPPSPPSPPAAPPPVPPPVSF